MGAVFLCIITLWQCLRVIMSLRLEGRRKCFRDRPVGGSVGDVNAEQYLYVRKAWETVRWGYWIHARCPVGEPRWTQPVSAEPSYPFIPFTRRQSLSIMDYGVASNSLARRCYCKRYIRIATIRTARARVNIFYDDGG